MLEVANLPAYASLLFLLGVAAFVIYRRWKASRTVAEAPPHSIVALLSEARPLSAFEVASAVSRATGLTITPINPSETSEAAADEGASALNTCFGRAPLFVVNLADGTYIFHCHNRPYFNSPEKAPATVFDMRMTKLIKENNGWISFDRLDSPTAEELPAVNRLLARTIACFLDERVLALYHPPTDQAHFITEESPGALQSDEPIASLFEESGRLPVIRVDNDPRIAIAQASAQSNWPEFAAAFRDPQADDMGFCVKTALESRGNVEHIWVDVTAIHDRRIEGILGNDPVDLPGYSLGSPVEIEIDRIEDWMFLRSGEIQGGFSVAVLAEIAAEQQKRN